MPELAVHYDSTAKLIQHSVTSYFFGWGLGYLFYGPATDRFGRRPVLIAGLSLYTLVSLALTNLPSAEALIAMRALHGAAAAVGSIISVLIITDICESSVATKQIGLRSSTLVASSIISPVVGALALTNLGLQAPLLILAAFGAGLLAYSVLVFEETSKSVGSERLCCTNRLMAELPLSPGGLIPQLP